MIVTFIKGIPLQKIQLDINSVEANSTKMRLQLAEPFKHQAKQAAINDSDQCCRFSVHVCDPTDLVGIFVVYIKRLMSTDALAVFKTKTVAFSVILKYCTS